MRNLRGLSQSASRLELCPESARSQVSEGTPGISAQSQVGRSCTLAGVLWAGHPSPASVLGHPVQEGSSRWATSLTGLGGAAVTVLHSLASG